MPHPALIPLHGVQDKKPRFLDREAVIVGRARGCDIGLDAPDISNLHCVISRGPEGYRIRDCASRAGTKINGVSIKAASLHDGDVLQIGPFSFTLQIPELVQQGRAVDPAQVEHWKRSRRHLAKQALRLRRHLAKMVEKGVCHTPSELQKKAAELKERIHIYDQRHSELEQAERELVEEREKLRKEREEHQKHVQTVEKDLGRRLDEIDDQIHARWQEFQQRCKKEEDQLADALRTLPKSEVNRITSTAQAELQAQKEMQAKQAQKLREEQDKFAQAKQAFEQSSAKLREEQARLEQQRQELEHLSQKVHGVEAQRAQLQQQLDANAELLHAQQEEHARVKQQLESKLLEQQEQFAQRLAEELDQVKEQLANQPRAQAAAPEASAQLDDERQQLQAEKEQLAQVKKRLEAESRRLLEEQEQLARDNQKFESQVQELDENQEELVTIRAELEKERARLEQLKQQLDQQGKPQAPATPNSELTAVKKRLEQQAQQLLEEQQQLAKDNEQLEAQMQRLDEEQEALEEARRALVRDQELWEQKKKQANGQLNGQRAAGPAHADQDELKTGLAHVEAGLDEQRQSLALLMGEMAKIHKALQASHGQAGSQVSSAASDKALGDENAKLKTRIRELESQVARSRDRGNDSELLRHLRLLESEEPGADPAVQARLQGEIDQLNQLLQEREKEIDALKKQATPVAKGTLRESDLENYESELNQYRRQLETDREKLNAEIEQLRERNAELDEAVREMEMEMSRERAELARERTRLDRMREDVRLEMERLQRDGPVRESLASVQKLREEMNQRKQPSGTNPLNDRLKSIRNKLTD